MYKKFNLKVFYRTDEKICTQLIEDVRECFIQNFLSRMNNIEEDYVWIASELIIDKRDVIKVETEEVELETNADMIYFRPYIDQELYIGDVKIGEVRTDVEEFKSDEGGTLDFYGTGDENLKFTNNSTFINSVKAPTLHADELLVDNECLIGQINGLKARIGVLESDIALLKAEESNYINIWTIVDGEPMLVQKINKSDSEEQDDENL